MARWRCRVLGPRPRMLIISLAGMRRLLNLEEVAAAAHSIRRKGETCRRKIGASVFQVASLRAFIGAIGTFFFLASAKRLRAVGGVFFSIYSKTHDWELLLELSETEMLLRR